MLVQAYSDSSATVQSLSIFPCVLGTGLTVDTPSTSDLGLTQAPLQHRHPTPSMVIGSPPSTACHPPFCSQTPRRISSQHRTYMARSTRKKTSTARSGYSGEGFFSNGRRVGTTHGLSPHLTRAKALAAAENRRRIGLISGRGRIDGSAAQKGMTPGQLAAEVSSNANALGFSPCCLRLILPCVQLTGVRAMGRPVARATSPLARHTRRRKRAPKKS